METLSTPIASAPYQIVSFAWKLVQVSEGRQGERAGAAEERGAARAPAAATAISSGSEGGAKELAAAGRRSLAA